MCEFLILGAGFTGRRVAQRLAARGLRVTALRRAQIDFTKAGAVERLAEIAPEGCTVLHSVPSLEGGADAALLAGLHGRARRVVYLSTTGVYGAASHVEEHTAPAPRTPRELARAATEAAVAAGPWSSLILRPAAIYGPGRGIHVSMAQGRYTMLGEGDNYISRIHVDDLAAVAEAAMLSSLTGAYPVADEYPCTSREIAEYCARLLSLPMPVSAPIEDVPASRRSNRRVDGRAIFRALGVPLRYPTYREGIAASLSS